MLYKWLLTNKSEILKNNWKEERGKKNKEQMGQIENLQQHGRAISSRINNHIKCKWSTLIIRQSLSDCI